MFADDTSADASAVDRDRLDDGAARVLLSSTDSSVTDVETPGTDCVMVALLVRSRITSLTEVTILLEEVLLLAVDLEMCLVMLFVVAVFVNCSLRSVIAAVFNIESVLLLAPSGLCVEEYTEVETRLVSFSWHKDDITCFPPESALYLVQLEYRGSSRMTARVPCFLMYMRVSANPKAPLES